MNALSKLSNSVKSFHSDEAGLQALDVVMIVAIAAVILTLVAKFGKTFFQSVQGVVINLVN